MTPLAATAPSTPPRGSPPVADRGRTGRVLGVLVLAGVCFDLVLRSHPASVAGTAALVVVAVGLVVDGAVRDRVGWAMVAVASMFAVLLSLRASPWLFPLNAVAAAGLLVLVAGGVTTVDALTSSPLRVVRRGARVLTGLLHAPAFVLDRLIVVLPLRDGRARDHARSIGRGLGLAVPLLAVLGALLASSDAVFASFFDLRIDATEWIVRVTSVLIGSWLASAVLWLASDSANRAGWREEDGSRDLGAIEAGVVLGSLVGLYGLFVLAQGLAVGASEAHLLRTTGLTRAEYARSGFFQLLWAAGITLAALLGVHRFTAVDVIHRRWMRVLNLAAVSLTLVAVGVAIRRLGLYEEAFGLTMLRLYSSIFAWWLGVVLVVAGIYVARPWRRAWWPAALAVTALATLLALNVVDPERLVVERNLAAVAEGRPLDLVYLGELSEDAVAALAAAADRLDGPDRDRVVDAVCRATTAREGESWYGFNASVARSDRIRTSLCG